MNSSTTDGVAAAGSRAYVLVTAAYNEDKFIENTIRSVIAQTLLPLRWIIVSDGSTDKTDAIVRDYAGDHSFISLHRITEEHPRNFAAQVNAIAAGYALLKPMEFDFFANLDADITLQPTYYERLIEKFEADPSLGLAGGFVHENLGAGFRSRPTNSSRSIAHAVQMFRRTCFESIGGYMPLKYGGPDWAAEVMLRQRGWRTVAFADLPVHHHRPGGSAGGYLREAYRQGLMDYSLGSVPAFEILKCIRRLRLRPRVIGALVRLTAFTLSYCTRAPRLLPADFISYLRSEQRQRLWSMFHLKSLHS